MVKVSHGNDITKHTPGLTLALVLSLSLEQARNSKVKVMELIAEAKEVDREKPSEIFGEIMNGGFATDIVE